MPNWPLRFRPEQMSLKVIELNDRALAVGDETGVLLQSPGFALVDGTNLILGQQAEQQARLLPTCSFSKYWHELNLESINHVRGFRHHADLAFAHLCQLAEEAGLDGEVIMAVPGCFSRQQLSILLGLVQHCPFRLTAMVDSALLATLAMAAENRAGSFLFADLQLHQVVITRLRLLDYRLEAREAVQIPGVGSQNFANQMMQLASGMFIQQCRFDPQHNAESEQQLYNRLPAWLRQAEQDSNLIMELAAGESVHSAKMPMDSLKSALSGHHARIGKQIAAMRNDDNDSQLILSPALADLPGFRESLDGIADPCIGGRDSVIMAGLQLQERIAIDEEGISLVRSLPVDAPTAAIPSTAGVQDRPESVASCTTGKAGNPTHVLIGHRALPTNRLRLRNSNVLNGSSNTAEVLALSNASLPELVGTIEHQDDGIYIDTGELAYWLNDSMTSGQHRLAVGDRIRFDGGNEVLTMIEVCHV